MKLFNLLFLILFLNVLTVSSCAEDTVLPITDSKLSMLVDGTLKTSTACTATYSKNTEQLHLTAYFSSTEWISIWVPNPSVGSFDVKAGGYGVMDYIADKSKEETGIYKAFSSANVEITSFTVNNIKGTFDGICQGFYISKLQKVITSGTFDIKLVTREI